MFVAAYLPSINTPTQQGAHTLRSSTLVPCTTCCAFVELDAFLSMIDSLLLMTAVVWTGHCSAGASEV
jgi:hypothetical protein